jgi:hypothetical protein
MRLRSLKHVIEVVNSLLCPRRITVLGSSALLAHSPDLGEPGNALELSLDADLLVEPCDENKAAVAHEAVGEDSLFHREYGVYADFMRPEIVKTFPEGWQKRCLFLEGDKTVRCLHPIDLAVIKLVLGRDKDIALLKSMIKTGITSIDALREAYQRTTMAEKKMFKAGRILRRLEVECGGGYETSSDIPPVVRETKTKYKAVRKKQKKVYRDRSTRRANRGRLFPRHRQ